jgi:Flp pilus assembly protein TadD
MFRGLGAMRQRVSFVPLAFAALLAMLIAGQSEAQQGRVSGLVKDDKGDPIKGATIIAENPNIGSSFTATTDDRGRFTIIGLRSGDWRFFAQAPGFSAEGGSMTVRQGSPNPPVQFVLHRTGPGSTGAMAGIAAKDLQAELGAADALFNQQRWDEAVAAYRSIMNKTPVLSVINLQIAAAYRHKRDYDAALTAYNALLTIDPGNEKAVVGIGQTNLERGDVKAAEAALLKAAEGTSAGREVFYNLGEVKSASNQNDEAAKWYEKASGKDPSWGKPLYRLGMMALNRGDRQGAAKLFDRVIAVDPISPEAAMAKGALDQLNR